MKYAVIVTAGPRAVTQRLHNWNSRDGLYTCETSAREKLDSTLKMLLDKNARGTILSIIDGNKR